MMCALVDVARQDAVRVRFMCVPDEETEDVDAPLDRRARRRGAHAATSRSPASRPTCTSASRRRACSRIRLAVHGTAAHGSTPWLGDNAILKAHDVFRRIETLPFSARVLRAVRPPLDQPRADRRAATRSTRSPTAARSTSTSAICPTRSRSAILGQIRAIGDLDVVKMLHPRARDRARGRTRTSCALRDARRPLGRGRARCPSGATAPPTPSRSSRPACRRSSSAPSAAATTGRRSGSRSASLRAYRAGARRLRRASCPAPERRRRRAAQPRGRLLHCPTRELVLRRARRRRRRPRPGRRMLPARLALARRSRSSLLGRRGRPRPRCSRSTRPSTTFVRERARSDGVAERPRRRRGGQAADDPGPRLRPALRRASRTERRRARTR